MSENQDLKTIIDRKIRAIRLRPSIGQGTATTVARVRGGITCEIEDGGWKLIADESVGDGGGGLGPDPGVYGRAALGSCLAIGYAEWAAHMEVPIDTIEVVVEADYDARGMFGIDDSVPPGWGAIRCTTTIASSAPPERIRELVEYADRMSPLLDDMRRALPVTNELRIASAVKE